MTYLLDPAWEYVPDAVMGGQSQGHITHEDIQGRAATRLLGDVSLENNGGFIQMAFDFAPEGGVFDARDWLGLEVTCLGNGEEYELRLRTTDLDKPWQSFRSTFTAPSEWTTQRFAFAGLKAHRTDAAFRPENLRRCGLVAVGRAFHVDLAVAAIAFYR